MEQVVWVDSAEGEIIDPIPYETRKQARAEAYGSVARLRVQKTEEAKGYPKLQKSVHWGLFEDGVCARVYSSRATARSRRGANQQLVKLHS